MTATIGERGLIQRARQSLLRLAAEIDGGGSGRPVPTVVAGYSGGADSLALIVVLRELERLGLVWLMAAHVDHGVRKESAQDGATAEAVADRLGVAFRLCRIDPNALELHRGVGLEEAMRRERYRLLAAVADDLGSTIIATGHHQRDQAETVLLHLMRGSGLRGVSGMREAASIVVPWWADPAEPRSLRLWRPLLEESSASLRSLVASLELPVVEDASNDSDAFRRNAVRHQALPVLNAIVPGAEANIAAFARRAADDDVAMDTIADERLGMPTGHLDRAILLGQPVAIQRRMARRWIAARAPEVELTAERTEAILHLAERNAGGRQIEIGGGWRVVLRDGVLTLELP